MELRFLMTGSWWPPAQVRVVQEPIGSSSVRRRAWPCNWVNVLLGRTQSQTPHTKLLTISNKDNFATHPMWRAGKFLTFKWGTELGIASPTYLPRLDAHKNELHKHRLHKITFKLWTSILHIYLKIRLYRTQISALPIVISMVNMQWKQQRKFLWA